LALANDQSQVKEIPNHHLATVEDVARYILHKAGRSSPIRLQVLCFYSQAWTLAWSELPLFKEEFLAHSFGPFCKELDELAPFETYRLNDGECGEYDDSVLSADQKEKIDVVFEDYNCDDTDELLDLVTQELPWLVARNGLSQKYDSDAIISKDDMEEYYLGLLEKD
jgi:uncharacterized phage-associated protein